MDSRNQTNTKETDAKELKRYSDAELLEFEELIILKIQITEEDIENIKSCQRNENGIDDTCPTFKILEEGWSCLNKEEAARLIKRLEDFKKRLENALIRVKNKTYGVCCVTGKLIPKPRLKSCPHTTMSVEAKEASVSLNGNKIKINGNGVTR